MLLKTHCFEGRRDFLTCRANSIRDLGVSNGFHRGPGERLRVSHAFNNLKINPTSFMAGYIFYYF